MTTKMGSWLVISTLAVAALWAAPADADSPEACYEEYATCAERASWEPVDWIRDYTMDLCNGLYVACMLGRVCGDNVCDVGAGESNAMCPVDCP